LQGPSLRFINPCLEFGLVRLGSQQYIQVAMLNESDVYLDTIILILTTQIIAYVSLCERGNTPRPFQILMDADGNPLYVSLMTIVLT